MSAHLEFTLKDKDYDFLQTFVSKGSAKAREIKRAEVLLLLHNQLRVSEIAELFSPSQA